MGQQLAAELARVATAESPNAAEAQPTRTDAVDLIPACAAGETAQIFSVAQRQR
jgi:hypothetical protein